MLGDGRDVGGQPREDLDRPAIGGLGLVVSAELPEDVSHPEVGPPLVLAEAGVALVGPGEVAIIGQGLLEELALEGVEAVGEPVLGDLV